MSLRAIAEMELSLRFKVLSFSILDRDLMSPSDVISFLSRFKLMSDGNLGQVVRWLYSLPAAESDVRFGNVEAIDMTYLCLNQCTHENLSVHTCFQDNSVPSKLRVFSSVNGGDVKAMSVDGLPMF